MIWHIFKKDCRLLWPLIVLVALTEAISTLLWMTLGHFDTPRELVPIARIFPLLTVLGVVMLTVASIHQDAIPGVRQDWLVRPIKRQDLLLAKIVFVLLAVQSPLFVVAAIEALLDGFSIGTSLSAALSRSLIVLVSFSLPAVVLATITRNLTEAIAAGFILIIGWMWPLMFVPLFPFLFPIPQLSGSGLTWMIQAMTFAAVMLTAVIVLPLQYFRRKTVGARWLVAAALVAATLSNFLPWNLSFALQQQLSPQPDLHRSISLAFEPTLGRYQAVPALNSAISPINLPTTRVDPEVTVPKGTASIFVPLHFSNLPGNSSLLADRYQIRMIGSNGKILFSGFTDTCSTSINGAEALNSQCANTLFEVRHEQHKSGDESAYQRLHLWPELYARIKDQPIRLEIDYSLTLFRLSETKGMPALDGDQHFIDASWCATRMDDDGDEVELRCISPRKTPYCLTVYLEHTPSGTRNPERHICVPNYAPNIANVLPDVMYRFGLEMPFFDPSGLAKFPVDGTLLAKSNVILKTYQPEDHFTQRVVIPEIRLSDWEAKASATIESAAVK